MVSLQNSNYEHEIMDSIGLGCSVLSKTRCILMHFWFLINCRLRTWDVLTMGYLWANARFQSKPENLNCIVFK